MIKSDWYDIKNRNIDIDFEKFFFWDFTKPSQSLGKQGQRVSPGASGQCPPMGIVESRSF
jgi:hypothetical protein